MSNPNEPRSPGFSRGSVTIGSLRIGSYRKYSTAKPHRGETPIRCDRKGEHGLGNPFFMEEESQRNQVCDQFEEKLNRDLAQKGHMSKKIDELAKRLLAGENLILMCWCTPKRCHTHSIEKAVLARINELQKD